MFFAQTVVVAARWRTRVTILGSFVAFFCLGTIPVLDVQIAKCMNIICCLILLFWLRVVMDARHEMWL